MVLRLIIENVKNETYVVTLHAEEEIDNDGLSIIDIEYVLLNCEILEKQKDKITKENKYRVRGKTWLGRIIEIIVKISPTGKLVIITVYSIL
ncbi:MAG: DUF4258 domain-containing protein [FCB group bacterium]